MALTPGDSRREELTLDLPPHARIVKFDFNAGPGKCRVSVGDGSARSIAAEDVRSIHGARIRHETFRLLIKKPNQWGRLVFEEESSASAVFALGLHVSGMPEVLYLIADSFNFRDTLAAESTSLTGMNLVLLANRLSAFAPHAKRDAFVSSLDRSWPMPPPVDSLMDFLWTVARSEIKVRSSARPS